MIIEKNIEKIKQRAKDSVDENYALLEMLNNDSFLAENANIKVKDFYNEIQGQIKCEECGECCREVLIVFEKKDIEILAQHLKENKEEIIKKYFHYFEKFDCYVMNSSPCVFQKNNLCTIYEYRGTECREFPYLDSKPFSEIFKYVFQGYSICPIHFNVIEMLKKDSEIIKAKGDLIGA